jgi:diguanylate cyclase (GGDEF)-like protein
VDDGADGRSGGEPAPRSPVPRVAVTAVAVALVALILGADVRLGHGTSALLLLVPVAAAAWFVGVRAGLLVAAVASLATPWALALDRGASSSGWSLLADGTLTAAVLMAAAWFVGHARQSLDEQHELATVDPLTGLNNRRAFLDRVDGELARANRHAHPVGLVYLDVDGLKELNDEEGHEAGDLLLARTAEGIRTTLRRSDVAARLGGDEFAVFLPETSPAAADALATRLRLRLLADDHGPIQVSIGLVSYPSAPSDLRRLLRQADLLMYVAKHQRLGIVTRVREGDDV